MAEAQAVIARLAQQVAQLTVDKAVLETEVAELRALLEAGTSDEGEAHAERRAAAISP